MTRYDYYKKKVNKKRIASNIIFIYLIAVIFVILFNSLIFQAYKIPSNSMEPNIRPGTRVIVNKFLFGPNYPFTDFKIFDGTKNVKRGDILLFYSSEYISTNKIIRMISSLFYTISFSFFDLSTYLNHYDNNIYIKRVVGLPNDKIKYAVVNGKVVVLINGIPEKKVIDSNYGLIEETDNNSVLLSNMILQNEYIVKENEFYVLGDNRINSNDSRIWGSISKKQIIGKAIIKYWPTNVFGVIK
jgi:signal peptidase I